MDWNAKTGTDVLNSIVALLLSLADLAERAAVRSPWVRWCVLWSAWQADLIARDYVAGSAWNEAGRLWSPVLPTVRYGTEPAVAMDLAASLRSLALIVRTMAAQRRRQSRLEQYDASGGCRHVGKPHHHGLQRMSGAAFAPVALHDTS